MDISVGDRFGSRTVVRIEKVRREYMPVLRCECGREARAHASELRDGRGGLCRSCSSRAKAAAKPRLSHGAARVGRMTPEYKAWTGVLNRCRNPENRSYARYGRRGVRVADEWQGEHGFACFLGHVGPRPSPAHSIDRIDNARGYEPGNVRWATATEQANNRRTSRILAARGEVMTVAQWARRVGLSVWTLHSRLRMGWSPEQAVYGK